MQAARRPYSILILTSASCQQLLGWLARGFVHQLSPFHHVASGSLSQLVEGSAPSALDSSTDRSSSGCCRHSQADLRAFLELPPPLVAHRAAADVAVLDEVVKGLARLAGVGNLDGLMTLDGVHRGSFQTYAGGCEHEHNHNSRCCLSQMH